jgi:TonB family protein
MNESVFLLMIFFLPVAPVRPAVEIAQASVAAQSVQEFSQSVDGFDSQFNSTIEAYRVGGEANGRRALDLFQLPRSEEWLTQRLGSDPTGKFTARYNRIFLSFADSLEKTIEDVQKTRGAKLLVSVKPDEPEAPSPPFYGGVPSGINALQEPPLFYCQFTIRLKGRDRVSWADEFVYDGGAFRFIGFGEQPFWVWKEGSEGSAPRGGSFVQPAVLISRVIPAYPPGALGKEGVVIVHYLIDEGGRVKSPKIVSGDPAFTKAAIKAINQWRYRPATMGGMPIETDATAALQFHPGP